MESAEDMHLECPMCSSKNFQISSMLYSVPFFNELAIFSMKCPDCGFSQHDVFSAEQRKPSRFTLRVSDESLLRVRVVRSSSGTFRFPEFGIDVEPGPAAESFITNVEGLLYRVRGVVESSTRFAETNEEKSRAFEILEQMESALRGEYPFTLVMEDPAGTSGILPENMSLVKYEELTKEEASKLKGAPFWIDTVREEYLSKQ
jgi:zinc finger protein